MPPAKKPTKTVVKTKKNPDGSQQYVRGNTQLEKAKNAWDVRDKVRSNPVNLDDRAALSKSNKATRAATDVALAETKRLREEEAKRKKKKP